MPKVRSSRRVPPLKESDIDHEINLVDRSTLGNRAQSPISDDDNDSGGLTPSESQAPLTNGAAPLANTDREEGTEANASFEDQRRDEARERPRTPKVIPSTPGVEAGPSSTNEQPTQSSEPDDRVRKKPSKRQGKKQVHPRTPDTEIDILYENERGGFLCGFPLFSGAALGNLDPSPWTNAAHKTSPTSIKTAQVPDPSWEWAWPSWRVNHDDAIEADKEGWEYSFMFHRKFSWHGPHWYNSFVRRRAWIRRRVKKGGDGYQSNGDPHLLNTDYFAVTTPASKRHSRQGSSVGADSASRTSALLARDGDDDDSLALDDIKIESVETLLDLLRRSRIDREKLDAVQNYLENNTDDLARLRDCMHEIMSLFVFQASRRLLLTRLMETHDREAHWEQQRRRRENKEPPPTAEPPLVKLKPEETDGQAGARLSEGASPEKVAALVSNLAAAIKHADEEVRRLEYWSDVKGMAENGASGGAVDDGKGWEGGWEGIDRSGGMGANKEELP